MSTQYHEALGVLAQLAAAEPLPIYLVGGCVRDQLLNRPSADYDLVSAGDPTIVAQRFARQIKAKWFWLDSSRRYSRVIGGAVGTSDHSEAQNLQFDFAPLRADSINADLALRDFTINAMALELSPQLDATSLIDPLGGKQDLAKRCLRMCGDLVIFDDPLRIIKGLRHCAQLNFMPAVATQAAFQRYAPLLKQVAGERIRSELGLLLGAKTPQHALTLLFDCGVASALDIAGEVDLVLASYQLIKEQIVQLYARNTSLPKAILLQPIGDNYSLKQVIYFGVILRCCNIKGDALDEVIKRLHFQHRVAQCLRFTVNLTSDDLTTFAQLTCSQRGKLLWLHQHHAPLPQGLFICALLQAAAPDVAQLEELYVSCQQVLHNGRITPLLTSKRLQQMFPQCVGSQLGRLFKQLVSGEINGQVWTAQQGESYLKKCNLYDGHAISISRDA